MGSAGQRCDVCLGLEENIVPSSMLSQLLRKHLGVIVCGKVQWCESCKQLLKLWDDFSLRARQNLSLGNHTLLVQNNSFQGLEAQVVTVDLDSDDEDDVVMVESTVSTSASFESSINNTPDDTTSDGIDKEARNEETLLLEVESCSDVENVSKDTENDVEITSPNDVQINNEKTVQSDSENDAYDLCDDGCHTDLETSPGNCVDDLYHPYINVDDVQQTDNEESAEDTEMAKTAYVDPLCAAEKNFPNEEVEHVVIREPSSPVDSIILRKQHAMAWGIPKLPSPERMPNDPVCDPLSFELSIVKTEQLDDDKQQCTHHKCSICSKKFFNPCALQVHSKFKHGITPDGQLRPTTSGTTSRAPLFKCNVCFRCFPNKQTLTSHHRSVHEKISKTQCKFCMKIFKSREILCLHVDNVHERKEVSDDSSKWSIECQVCSKKHFSRRSLDSHMAHDHPAYQPNVRESPRTRISPKTRTFTCGAAKFQSQKDHFDQEVHKKADPGVKLQGTNEYFKRDTHSAGVNTVTTHQRVDNCEETNNATSVVTTPQTSNCKFCDKTFNSSNDLLDHIHEAHFNLRQVQKSSEVGSATAENVSNSLHKYTKRESMLYCNFCLKSYSSLTPMLKHIQSIHLPHIPFPTKNKIKVFTCKSCKKKFPSKRLLILHEKDHFVALPVAVQEHKIPVRCTVCKEYFEENELLNHTKLHKNMKKTPEASAAVNKIVSHMCDYCGRCLLSKRAMEYHIQMSHLEPLKLF